MLPSPLIRVLSWFAAALIGAIFGVAGTIAHSVTLGPVPTGMVLGAVSCAAILVAVRTLSGDRFATLATGVGMIAIVLLVSGRGPGGSVLVPDTLLGRIWTYLLAGIVLLAIAWPSISRPASRVAPAGESSSDAAGDGGSDDRQRQ